MKKIISLLLFIMVITGTIYIGSPYYAAYQLKKAYDAQDGASIATAIDYDQLRPNLQRQLSRKFEATMAEYPLIAQLGGHTLTTTADDFIAQSVEAAITPSNIEQLVQSQGQVNASTKQLAAAWAIASNQVDLRQLIQQIIATQGDLETVAKEQTQLIIDNQVAQLATQTSQNDTRPQLVYCGIDCFNIIGEVKGFALTVTMQRKGLLEWEIVNVVLP